MFAVVPVSDRCTATYGDVKCWRELGHKPKIHHGPGDTWWEPGEVPPPPKVPVDPCGVLADLESTMRPGMVVAAVIVRPMGRKAKGPVWLGRLAVWLLGLQGYEVFR